MLWCSSSPPHLSHELLQQCVAPHQSGEMVDIMVELFTSSDFNNQDRFISMLREALAGMENSVVTSGTHQCSTFTP